MHFNLYLCFGIISMWYNFTKGNDGGGAHQLVFFQILSFDHITVCPDYSNKLKRKSTLFSVAHDQNVLK